MRNATLWNSKLRTLTSIALFSASALICTGSGRPDFVETGYKLPGSKIPEHAKGPKIVEKLAERLQKVAMKHGLTEEEFNEWVSSDSSVRLDELDNLYHVCEGLVVEAPGVDADATSFVTSTTQDAFNLSSNPGAALTIYLDFDGHVTSGTIWNNRTGGADFVTPPYDIDGNTGNFSSTELNNIVAIWKRVAEDFAPWQVNVTTVDPGSEALKKSSTSDTEYGIRAVIGGSSTDWYNSSAGGVAYLGSFTWNTDSPCFIFENQLGNGNVKYTAEATSHEVGHTFNLRHDGTTSISYYTGHGDWAPIMGVGYYEPITQWSKGEYANANNTEDDLAKISSYVPLRLDTAGDDIQTQATLGLNPIIEIIEVGADADIYSFQTDGGLVELTAEAISNGNLNVLLALYDGVGNLVASTDPSASLSASLSQNLSPGTYYACVEGSAPGNPSTAYTEYASIGQYRLTGVFTTSQNLAPVAVASTNSPTTARGPLSITFSSAGSNDSDGSIATYDWAFGDGSSSSSQSPTHVYNGAGVYTATLVVVDDKGASSSDSIVITVTEPIAPVADASRTSPTSGTAPLTVSLDGTRSSDSDGSITSYSWSSSNGATASGSVSSLTFTNSGTYSVSLQVIDNEGIADTDSVTITVNEPVVVEVEGLYVDSVQFSISGNSKKGYTAQAKVIVVNEAGKLISGAVVYGKFSGAVNSTSSATTRRKGDATLKSGKYRTSGNVSFEVTDVVLNGFEYIP